VDPVVVSHPFSAAADGKDGGTEVGVTIEEPGWGSRYFPF
jgi:hypothetical protein